MTSFPQSQEYFFLLFLQLTNFYFRLSLKVFHLSGHHAVAVILMEGSLCSCLSSQVVGGDSSLALVTVDWILGRLEEVNIRVSFLLERVDMGGSWMGEMG